MRKFLININILIGLISFSIIIIFLLPFVVTINPSRFLAAHIDKVNLLKQTPSPRIIFIGGSNLAFSLDSKEINRQTGYPVVNAGLEGALGLRLMLDDLKQYVRNGDIIVISAEYEHYSSTLDGYGADLIGIISADPYILKSIRSLRQIRNIYPYILMLVEIELKDTWLSIYNRNTFSSCENPNFCRYNFNSYGDEVAHLEKPSPGFSDNSIIPTSGPTNESIMVISNFIDAAKKKGAIVLYSFPPMAEEQFDRDKVGIEKINDKLQTIQGLKVIDSPSDYRLPQYLFYDQKYHLIREGRQIRTTTLIKKLIKYTPPLSTTTP